MTTDTMIDLAIATHADRVRTGARERLAGEAAAANPRRSLMQGIRFSLGGALIAAGGHLQGVATSLPERPTIAPSLSTGRVAN